MKKKTKKKPVARGVWKINPKTRVVPSKKSYKRAAFKHEAEKEIEYFSET